jgi:8-oxo-dGTP pyrophosphatase MutT (NUDIX family)
VSVIDEIGRRLAAYVPQEIDPAGRRQAAVLVPLYVHEDALHVVLTKRGDTLEHHRGEISFPGGGVERQDTDLTATALRECEEEIGLSPAHVHLIGRLDDFITISDFYVRPFVGIIDAAFVPYVWRLHEIEVAELLEVPAAHLLDPSTHTVIAVERNGEVVTRPGYGFRDHVIWGATGRILQNFLDVALPAEDVVLVPATPPEAGAAAS